MNKKKCVLAYSGGLDTSVMVPWLIEQGYEVFCVLVDVGQGEDLKLLEARAYELGAKECFIHCCKDELSEIFKYACFFNAKYENEYFLGTALTRPFIAKAQIDYARKIGAQILVHGATGKGNDQVRFEYAYKTLGQGYSILAPWKNWRFNSRKSLISYLKEKGFSFGFCTKKDYSIDKNVWHTSIEGSELEIPHERFEVASVLKNNDINIIKSQSKPTQIKFKDCKLAVNGKEMNFYSAVDNLNKFYLVQSWSIDVILENRQTGIKSRGIYITSGAKILYKGLSSLVQARLNKVAYDLYLDLAKKFSECIYNGEVFSLQYQTIIKSADVLLQKINGEVCVEVDPFLYVSRLECEKSLFKESLCTFNDGEVSHGDAAGFINLSWLSAEGGAYLEDTLE